MSKMKILFVCTGNTCRSPIAEGLASKLFPEITFSSAGIYAEEGASVSKNSVEAMKKLGIDISKHTAAQLTLESAKEFDYIIPMTENHRRILIQVGIDKDKIKLFDTEIPDPYSQPLETYIYTANLLKDAIIKLIGDINENN